MKRVHSPFESDISLMQLFLTYSDISSGNFVQFDGPLPQDAENDEKPECSKPQKKREAKRMAHCIFWPITVLR